MKYSSFRTNVSGSPEGLAAFVGNHVHSSFGAHYGGVCGFEQRVPRLETKSTENSLQPGMLSDEQRLAICGDLVLELVSLVNAVSRDDILASKRGVSAVSHARQQVMYLLNTSFSFTYPQVANWMKRDRTTISHACKVIEDMRDKPEFDRALGRMESILQKTMELGYV